MLGAELGKMSTMVRKSRFVSQRFFSFPKFLILEICLEGGEGPTAVNFANFMVSQPVVPISVCRRSCSNFVRLI